MNERIRRRAVDQLSIDINYLTPSEFEMVGHMLVSAIEDRPLVHRGLNPQAKPVGYTVDTFDGNRTVVAEYSTEANYFTPPFDKIKKDTCHACSRATDLARPYLVNNDKCQNSNWEGAVQAAKSTWNNPNGKIELYDSRRLAESIYEQVVAKTILYEAFVQFLPSLETVWRDFQFDYNRPQPPSDYVRDKDREDDLLETICDHPVVVIHGISGIGKSYLLRSVSAKLTCFDNVIWLNGDEVPKKTNSFVSVTGSRGGNSFNLAGQFNNSRTLLVVDGWEETIDSARLGELSKGLQRGSRIIISSQLAPTPTVHAFPITATKTDCAKDILTLGMTNLTPNDSLAVNTIVDRAGGHPLLMAIIRGLVADGDASLQEIAGDSVNWPSYEDPYTQRLILNRLFQQHETVVGDELATARWLRAKVLDGKLATAVFGISGVAKLRRRSLLTDGGHGLLRFHDTVFLCIDSWLGKADEQSLLQRFLAFFDQRLYVADYHFQRALHTCRAKITDLIRQVPVEPGLLHYLYLLLDLPEKNPVIVEQLAKARLSDHVDNQTAIECIIEARETWRQLCVTGTDPNQFDVKTVDEVDKLEGADLRDLTRHTLLHHRGKAYRRLGQKDDARTSFDRALAICPSAPHTRLQLARLTAGVEQAEHLRAIMEQFRSDENSVAITVVLAAIESAGTLKDITTVMPEDAFLSLALEAIAKAQCEGYGQPFATLAIISRALWYKAPSSLMDIVNRLVLPPPNVLDSRTAFGVAETMKNFSKAALGSGSHEKGQKWLLCAEPYYEKSDRNRQYVATMVAEYWVLREDGNRALDVLAGVPKTDQNAFFFHRRAQAHALTGNTSVALLDIDSAIAMAEPKYRAAFLDRKGEILLQAQKQDQARQCWQEAMACCNNDKFKADIQKKLDAPSP